MTQAAQAYEFDAQQDQIISMLASRMKALGIVTIAMGALVGVCTLFVLINAFLPGLFIGGETAVVLLIGIWTYQASKSFRMIVDTKGQDMMHLMSALESLRKLYNLQFWLLIAGIIIFVIAIILAVVVGAGAFMSMQGQAT